MDNTSNIRVTFSCPADLRERLTKQSEKEGIPRSQLIVELLESALGPDNSAEARNPAVNRIIFNIQERLSMLEGWRREIHDWTRKTEINTDNLETTVASILNSQLGEIDFPESSDPHKIPTPKKS